MTANEGSSASFTCIADGEPQPTVFWEREGKASSTMLPNMYYYGGRFFVTRLGESLQIAKIEKEDEGVYTCLALSQIGNSHAKAKLTVIGKDFFVPCFMPCFSTTLRYPLLYQRDKILFSNLSPFQQQSEGWERCS